MINPLSKILTKTKKFVCVVRVRLKRIKQRNEVYSFVGSRSEVNESLESGI